MAQAFGISVASVLWLVGLWNGFRSIKRPDRRGIRLLVLFYFSLAATVTVWSLPEQVDPLLLPVLGASPSAFIRNISAIPGLYAGMMFLHYFAGRDGTKSILWRVRVPFCTWALISLSTWWLTPPVHRGDALTDVSNVWHVVFFGVTLLGLGYSTTILGVPITLRLARQAPDPISARGFRIAAVGFGVCIPFFVGPRMLALLLALAGNPPGPLLEIISIAGQLCAVAFVATGFGLPIIRAKLVAVRLWLRHVYLTRKMAPLWHDLSALSEAYELLREDRTGVLPLKAHYRFYRRVIECRDGLLLAGRLVDPTPVPQSTREEALLLLSVINQGDPKDQLAEPGPPGWLFGAPAGRTVEDDAEALAGLAREVQRQRKQTEKVSAR